jgi:hypothetical protein
MTFHTVDFSRRSRLFRHVLFMVISPIRCDLVAALADRRIVTNHATQLFGSMRRGRS